MASKKVRGLGLAKFGMVRQNRQGSMVRRARLRFGPEGILKNDLACNQYSMTGVGARSRLEQQDGRERVRGRGVGEGSLTSTGTFASPLPSLLGR